MTNELVYRKLPKGVLEALKEKTPKNKKFHQLLTPEIGKEHLKRQIHSVAALGKISENKDEFLKLVERYNASKKKSYE